MLPDAEVAPRRLTRPPFGYTSPVAAAWAVGLLALVGLILAALAAAALYAQHHALRVGYGIGEARDRVADLTVAVRWVGLSLLAAIVWWLRRVYRNLRGLGVRRLRYGTSSAVTGWFVPVLHFVRPSQIVADVYRATDPDAGHPIGGRWRGRPVPGWIRLWWAVTVAVVVVWVAAAFAAPEGTATVRSVSLQLVAAVLALGALPLTFLVTARVSDRQEWRARRIGVGPTNPPRRPHLDRRLLGAAVASAVVLAGFGVVTWPVTPASVKVMAMGQRYERDAVVFRYPLRYTLTESGRNDGPPDATAGTAVVTSPDGVEQVTVTWMPLVEAGIEVDPVAVLDASVLGLVGEGEALFRGRPVASTVASRPAIFENVSILSGNDMAYAAVVVTGCADPGRLMAIVIHVDSTRSVRAALFTWLTSSASC